MLHVFMKEDFWEIVYDIFKPDVMHQWSIRLMIFRVAVALLQKTCIMDYFYDTFNGVFVFVLWLDSHGYDY